MTPLNFMQNPTTFGWWKNMALIFLALKPIFNQFLTPNIMINLFMNQKND